MIDDMLADPSINENLQAILTQFGKRCPIPPVHCKECGGAAGGWFDPNGPEIVICVDHNQDSASAGNYAIKLTHELTHALQSCRSRKSGCKDHLKSEIEAYYCQIVGPGGGDSDFDTLYRNAVGSVCSTVPPQCTPSEVQDMYQELLSWYNKTRGDFCKLNRAQSYPAPPRL
jgi:hypothetical protein